MNLSEIRERLERATGPDREIDRDLMALAYKRQGMFWVDLVTGDPKTTDPFGYAFTRRVDRALGLIERVLPGWGVKIESGLGHGTEATVGHVGANRLYDRPEGWATAPTIPLALLRALLAALEAGPNQGTEQ